MLFPQILREMKGQICDKLRGKRWKNYDRDFVATTVPKKPGVYQIGAPHKRSKKTISLYAGETNNLKRRSREHLNGKRQDIDKAIATLTQQNIVPKIRYVLDKNHKRNEGKFVECLTKRDGYPPLLNRRAGNSAGVHKRKKRQRSGSRSNRAFIGRSMS